ncbi:MAG: lipopolysaccharide biosynthesis protein [Anaeromyxobacteraceae bacterium]
MRGPKPAHWALLASSAVRRRKVLTAIIFLAGVVATSGYFALRMQAPTYRVDARILAQRQQALPSVVRSVYEDTPTRSAWEIIHQRENLIALAQRAGMLPTASDVRGRATAAEKPDDGEDPLDHVVTRLDKRLLVTVEEGTIAIRFDWDDPQEAYDVVKGAIDNFLEARHVQEVTAIDEVLAVLSGKAAALRSDYEAATADARHVAPVAQGRANPTSRQPSEELVRLQSQLESRQRALQEVEDLRRRRLAELHTQLDQARNTFADAHPTVIGLRKDIESLSYDSPQVVTLREAVRQSRRAYSERLAKEGLPSRVSAGAMLPPIALRADREEDPRVRALRLQYESLAQQLQTAQVERDAARAAFKFRYNVIWPPHLPREPVSPDPLKIFPLGLLASLLIAIGGAAAPDLLRGRIVQRWQIEQQLGLEVLGEIARRT